MHSRDKKFLIVNHTTVKRIPPVRSNTAAPLWKHGTPFGEFCGSPSVFLFCPTVFFVDSGLDTQEEIARFLDFSRIAEDNTARSCGLSKTFHELTIVSRVVGGYREPRLCIPLKLGISTVDKVRGMPLTCSLCQHREIHWHLPLNSLDFVQSWIRSSS